MLMNKMLVLKEFFERYQTLAIILVLSIILIAVFYLKKLFPKQFDNNEGLKTQDEIDKEDFENMIETQTVEVNQEETEEEIEEETYFINDNNRDKINKIKNKD